MGRSRHRGTVSLVVALTFLVQIVLPPAWAATPIAPPAANTTTASEPSAFQTPAKPKQPQVFDPQSLIPKPHHPFAGFTDVSDLNARLMENGLDGFQVAAATPAPLPTHRPVTLPNGYDATHAPAGTVVQANVFVGREKGKPTETELKFSVAHTAGPFVMHVQNGETNGDNRASSATVSVNDTDIFSQSDFNQEVGSLTKDVEVKSDNTIRVWIASKPGSKLYVAIVDVGKGDVTGLVQDADAKTPIKDAKVTLDNSSQMTPADGTFSFESILNGTVSLEASKTGYETETKSVAVMSGETSQVTFNLKDVAPPKVVLTSILLEITKEASQTVSGTVEDINSDIKQVTVFVNETPKQVPVANGVFSAAVSLQEGTNQVKAVAFDQADNKGQSNILTCRLDTGPPEFTITSPTSEAQTSASITLQGTVTEAVTGATIKVNDGEAKPLILTNLSFSVPVTLKNGENTVVLSGTDAAGNVGTLSKRYVYAATGTLNGLVTKAGSNEPIAGAKVKISNTNFEASTSSAGTYTIPGIPAGAFNVTVSAEGYASRTLPVLIAAGELKTLDASLAPTASGEESFISGYVYRYPGKTPLAGAKVTSTLGGQALTDADGKFMLKSSAVQQVLTITAEGYTSAERAVTPDPVGIVSVSPAYLTAVDTKVTRISSEGGVASNQAGTALIRVPEGALDTPQDFRITLLDTKNAGDQVLPGPLPNDMAPIVFAELQPHGITFKKPVTLLLPNTYGLGPGTRIPCAFWNPETQSWQQYAESFALEGTVTADAKFIEIPVSHFSYYGCLFRPTNPPPKPSAPPNPTPKPPCPSKQPSPSPCPGQSGTKSDDKKPCDKKPQAKKPCQKKGGGSEFSIATGELEHRFVLPAVPSLSADFQSVLSYSSSLAAQRPALTWRLPISSEIPATWRMAIEGRTYSGSAPPVSIEDARVEWDGMNGNGKPSAGGYHTYRVNGSFAYGSLYDIFSSNTSLLISYGYDFTGKLFIYGQPQIYGPGWHLSYDRRIVPSDDGNSVTLIDGEAGGILFSGPGLTPQPGVTTVLSRLSDGSYDERQLDGTRYRYDSQGLVREMTDRNGNRTTYDWLDGRLTKVFDQSGQTTQFAYDADGVLHGITDPAGRTYSITHDEHGRLTSIRDPLGGMEQYSYNDRNVMASKTDSEAHTTTYQTDSKGRLLRWDNADGSKLEINPVTNVALIVSSLENVRSDKKGNIWGQVTDSISGAKTLVRYSPNSNLAEKYPTVGHIAAFSFDEAGRIWAVKPLSGNKWGIVRFDSQTGQIDSYSLQGLRPADVIVVDRFNRAWFSEHRDIGSYPLVRLNLETGELIRFTGGAIQQAYYEQARDFSSYQFDPDGNIVIGVYGYTGASNTANQAIYGHLRAKIDIRDESGRPLGNLHRSGYMPYMALDKNGHRWGTAFVHNNRYFGQYLTEFDRNGQAIFTYIYNEEILGKKYYFTGDIKVDDNGTVWLVATRETTPYVYAAYLLSFDPNQRTWQEHPTKLYDTGDPQGIRGHRIGEFSVSGGNVWTHLIAGGSGLGQQFQNIRWVIDGWEMTDSRGGKTAHFVDNHGRTRVIRDALGNKTQYAYETDYNLAAVFDPLGNKTTYTYDSRGNVLTETNPLGHTTTYTYESSFNRLTSVTEPIGGTTTYSYDSRGNLSRITDPVGLATTFENNPDGTISSATEPGNRTTRYAYDNRGLVTSVTDAADGTASLSYDAAGNPTQVTDALGRSSALQYDLLNRLTSYTNALGQSTAYTYNGVDDLVQTTDAKGRNSTFTYDAKRRLTGVSNAKGETTQLAYDTEGNLKSVTDPLGHSSAYDYDLAGRLAKRTNALGHATTFGYDARGDLTSIKDPLNRATAYAYDAVGRLTTITDAKGNVTGFAYDANGNRTKVIDARGKVYEHVYDTANRLIQLIDPLNRVTRYGYGDCSSCSGGLLAERTDAKGVLTKYTYDALKRLTKIDYPTEQTTFAYNAVGNVTETRNANTTIQLAYDDLNRLIRKEDRGKVIRYAYDEVGNRASMTDPEGQVTAYAYDQVNRLTGMTTPHGDYTLSYDAAGRRLNLAHPNGMVARYSYDDASRLLEVLNEHPATGVVAKAQYTYDANGNPVTKTDTQGTTSYQYDETDQLIGESGNGKTLAWLYDPVGNRLKETRNGQETTYTHDDANQLLSRSDGTTWTYDANGNMASETGPGGSSTYTFDIENRLTRVQKGSDLWQYVYGPANERIKRIAPDGERHYQLDGPDVLAEYDPSGGLMARNVHTLAIDEILSRTTGGQTYHYAVDGLGSVEALTATDGTVATSYKYEGFGSVSESGSAPNPYRFTGREDEGNGLYFYRARFYHPAIGRFINQDPIGFAAGDQNLLRYVFNSPTKYVDPSGLWGVGLTGGGTAEAGIGVAGAGAQASGGAGVYVGKEGVSVGAHASGGAVAGGPGYGVSVPESDSKDNTVVGAYAGVGVGIYITNANNAGDLAGTSNTVTINAGVGVKGSIQINTSDSGVWSASITIGPGAGLSGSQYPTGTGTLGTEGGSSQITNGLPPNTTPPNWTNLLPWNKPCN